MFRLHHFFPTPMQRAFQPEIVRSTQPPNPFQTINRQAHLLTVQSFAAIRARLEEKARALLRDGRSVEETLREIREPPGCATTCPSREPATFRSARDARASYQCNQAVNCRFQVHGKWAPSR